MMHPVRRQRLALLLFVVTGAAATLAFAMLALRENVNLFYEPAKIVGGEAPRASASAPAAWWPRTAWRTTTRAWACASW